MKVAKSFQNYQYDETKAYEKEGKLYVTIKCKCDRCFKGVYVCRVENNQPVPHPAFGGVCLKCGGLGYLMKEVRLYTDEEYERMERNNEKAREKRQIEQEKKMKAEFSSKKAKWLADNCFNKDEITYVYFPNDSYEVKDELKKAGFRFNKHLLWHIAEVPVQYAEKVVPVKLSEVAEISAWGTGTYKPGARKMIDNIITVKNGLPTNEDLKWYGEVGEVVDHIKVKLAYVKGYNGKYGYSQIVRFESSEGYIFKWFTTANIEFSTGDELLLSGTIKDLVEDKYDNGNKVTIVTRCKLEEV
jgi:hypothetical protein